MLANIEVDKVADMEMDKVVDIVADMEVYKDICVTRVICGTYSIESLSLCQCWCIGYCCF